MHLYNLWLTLLCSYGTQRKETVEQLGIFRNSMNPTLQDAVRNRFHRETLEWNHPGSGGIAVWSHDGLLWAHSLHLDFQHLWIMSCCFTNLPIKCFASLCWTLIKASMSTEEETEENWPQHDRRALKLRSSDTHRLWWNGRWHAAGKTCFIMLAQWDSLMLIFMAWQ